MQRQQLVIANAETEVQRSSQGRTEDLFHLQCDPWGGNTHANSQDSSDDYTVSGSNITFTTAPASGLSFSAVSLGVAFSVNTTGVGIQSAGSQIGVGITQINFTGPSNSVTLSGLTADINIASGVGIQSAGTQIGAGITQLNFVGTGNTFAVNGDTIDISISGGGGGGLSLDSYYFTGV